MRNRFRQREKKGRRRTKFSASAISLRPGVPLAVFIILMNINSLNFLESNSQPNQQQQQQQEAKCRRSVEVEDAGSSSTNSEASSANNSTNQQDTSDYVSASGEELSSITDWEYQIPAPPSAFRDDEDAATASSTTITQLSTG